MAIARFILLLLGFSAACQAHPAKSGLHKALTAAVTSRSLPKHGPAPQVTTAPVLALNRAYAGKNDFLSTAKGGWKDVRCNNPGLTDAFDKGKKRWKAARAAGEHSCLNRTYWFRRAHNSSTELWKEVMDAYKDFLKNDKRLPMGAKSFDAYFANALHLEDFPQCWRYQGERCTGLEQCEETVAPAVWLIKNSIVTFGESINGGFEQLSGGLVGVEGNMEGFASAFAKNKKKSISDKVFKWILDSLAFAIGIGSAFSWNVYDDYRGAFKDVFNAAVAYSIILPKDGVVPETAKDIVPFLKAVAAGTFNGITKSHAKFLDDTIRAHNKGNQTVLTNLLANGAMLDLALNEKDSWETMQAEVSRMFYGRMLPVTWELSPVKQRPFVLRVDREQYKCGSPVKPYTITKDFNLGNYMTADTAKKTQYCDKYGNTWFLLNANHPSSCRKNPQVRFCSEPPYYKFTALQGGTTDELDGKKWGGITIKDIVESSYGFFNFTVCLDAKEAGDRIWDREEQVCPEKPSDAPVNPNPNRNGYTEGMCRIHVTQWAREKESKGTNPLKDHFLVATAIIDAAGKLIAQATKQPISPAYIIKSPLSRTLAVRVGSKEDHTKLCFWYSDQRWCSDDCSLGGWDGGKREMDCGFRCPNPKEKIPDTALVDETKNAPIAFMGTGEDPDEIGTSRNFKPGKCRVHIRHYQKNHDGNSQNPSGFYALEVNLYDAGGSLIDYLDKTYAPEGEHLHAQGPLPHKVVLWTGAVDSNPIYLAYTSQRWDTKNKGRCSEGGYDSGMRQIDCDFDC
ncbi:predicted protein [Uncinocarpus reesii 1704]|uniref:SRP54-type proteins GTP-binding domain-containing protein n=1 Tax=Uncinocarpus reesii (strain UAMH 1704) TaxID=336963 RepID=C4JVZ0_UNCRE|nr:uncharacterized protein UREG_06732 [Uncinocarpus reesii 1704]EEP81867.1 predicted protein [Uncinocarpus reesii 1704]